MGKIKIIRTSTIPLSLNVLLKGQLKYLNQFYEIVAVSGLGLDANIVQKREGVRVVPIEMERKIKVFNDLVTLIRLYKCFIKEKPLIVHSITPKAGLLSMIAAKFAKVPVRMHTFTGLVFPSKTGFKQKLLITMDRILCWSATNVYPEGEGVKKDLIKHKITNKTLKILANGNINGIDTSHFTPLLYTFEDKKKLRESYNISEKDYVFIFIGRLVKDKGINELVASFAKLNESFVKLLLVGPYENEIDPLNPATLKEIEHNSNIISVGWKDDVRPYLAISDVFVFPSYREGFPNVVIQAGAMGLASIVTDINGCNEIVIQNINGLIIPPKNEKSLLEAMFFFLNHPDEIRRMAENARQIIAERYEQQKIWEALLDEYKSLLRNKQFLDTCIKI